MSNYQEYKKHKDSINDLVEKFGAGIVEEMFANIFERNPDCKYYSLTAYTPSFNDGDPCEFTVNSEFAPDFLGSFEDNFLEIAQILGYTGDDEEEAGDFLEENMPSNDFDWGRGYEIQSEMDQDLIRQVHGEGVLLMAFIDQNGKTHVFETEYDCGY